MLDDCAKRQIIRLVFILTLIDYFLFHFFKERKMSDESKPKNVEGLPGYSKNIQTLNQHPKKQKIMNNLKVIDLNFSKTCY